MYTQQWYMSYRFVDSFQAGAYDDGQTNCPKHVEFHDKKICEISASSWFHYKEKIMEQGLTLVC